MNPTFASAHPDVVRFKETAFNTSPRIADCTPENGVKTQRHQITVGDLPQDLDFGPFCPATLDGAGGIREWTGQRAYLYRVDGVLLNILDGFGDCFFDDDDNVDSIDNATERPTVDHDADASRAGDG